MTLAFYSSFPNGALSLHNEIALITPALLACKCWWGRNPLYDRAGLSVTCWMDALNKWWSSHLDTLFQSLSFTWLSDFTHDRLDCWPLGPTWYWNSHWWGSKEKRKMRVVKKWALNALTVSFVHLDVTLALWFALWSWAGHLTSLCSSFYLCKTGDNNSTNLIGILRRLSGSSDIKLLAQYKLPGPV